MSIRVSFEVSDFVANFREDDARESHPILAFVGSAALRTPPCSRFLTRDLTKAGSAVQLFTLAFEPNPNLAKHDFAYALAVQMQLHTHRTSDNGEITEVCSAVGDRCVFLSHMQPHEPIDFGVVQMLDYPAKMEDERFHNVLPQIMNEAGPASGLPWTTKATFRLRAWLLDPLPEGLRGRNRGDLDLSYFNGTLKREVTQHREEAKANLERLEKRFTGLRAFEVEVYTLGPGVDVPTGVLLTNQSYAAPTSEALHESRLLQTLHMRHITSEAFAAALRRVVERLALFERAAQGASARELPGWTPEPPTTFELECTNLVIEALLTIAPCGLPYTFDKSVAPGEEVDVERPDMRARRAVDCEDTSIEISLCHEELVRNRLRWRSELVRLSAEFLAFYECVVTRGMTSPVFDGDHVRDGELHICPLLVLRPYLFDMMVRGVDAAPWLDAEQRRNAKLSCRAAAFKPAWWFHGVSRSESHPSSYFTDVSLPSFPELHNVRPPARAVYLADGCSSMVPSQGPPELTHPDQPEYFAALEAQREQVYSALLKSVHKRISHEYPLTWNKQLESERRSGTAAAHCSQSRFYHTYTSFSVRHPLLAALREYGSLAVPTAPQTQSTVLEFALVGAAGRQGVLFEELVTLDAPGAGASLPAAVPYGFLSRDLAMASIDLLGFLEPIYPMLQQDLPARLMGDLHLLPEGAAHFRPSNLFAEFPIHSNNYKPEVLRALERADVPGLGTSVHSETFFINLGACEPQRDREFLGEPALPIHLEALGLTLPELHQMAVTAEGRKQLTRLAGPQPGGDDLLWFLTFYEKLLEEPLCIYMVRLYYEERPTGDDRPRPRAALHY